MNEPHHKFNAFTLRDRPIVDLVERLGGVERGTKPHYRTRKFRIGDRTYIVTPAENLFRDIDNEFGSRGAINFMKCAAPGMTYTQQLAFIAGAAVFAPAAPLGSPVSDAVRMDADIKVPDHDPRAWKKVREYLVGTRCLPEDYVCGLRAEDKLRSFFPSLKDGRTLYIGNCLFVCRSLLTHRLAGLIRGTGSTPFKSYCGPRHPEHVPVFCIGDGEECWITESAIDAISAHVCHSEVRVIALSGNHVSPEAPTVAEAVGSRSVVIATNRDSGGDSLARKILEAYPGASRVLPPGGANDWNQYLQDLKHRNKGMR